MINIAPLLGLYHELIAVLGMGAGIILGYAAGRPIKRWEIRKWGQAWLRA